MKHTPGPWNMGTKNGARIWSENGEILIADADASESLRKETKKSNARLIAAAPDLLEALQKMLHDNSYYFPVGNPWGDRARAAITKATRSDA